MKKYFFGLILLLLALNFSACITKDKFQTRRLVYRTVGKRQMCVQKLVLTPDGTFHYKFNSDLLSVSSRGRWENRPDEIVLTSDSLYRSGYLELEETKPANLADSLHIQILSMEDQRKLPYALIDFGKEAYAVSDVEGSITCSRDQLSDQIEVSFLGENYPYQFTHPPKGDLKIYVNEVDLSKRYFQQAVWRKQQNRLINPEGIILKRVKGE